MAEIVKTTAFQMRVTAEWIASLDKWRGNRSPIPSRAEAIRQLVAENLSPQTSRKRNVTNLKEK